MKLRGIVIRMVIPVLMMVWFNTARHFSEWQKQQMMKDAVDAKVTARWPLHSSPLYNSYEMYVPYAQHLSEGDKVKLIIINED